MITVNNIRLFALTLLVFFLPISQKISTLLIVFNGLLALLDYKKIKFDIAYIPFLLIYILYLFTSNFDSKILEQKSAFIAFPLIFISLTLSKKNIKDIFLFFVYGCLVNYSVSLLYGLWASIDFQSLTFNPIIDRYRSEGYSVVKAHIFHTTFFLGKQMANSMHASYLSIYYVFALYIVYVYKSVLPNKIKLFSFVLVVGVFQIFTILGLLLLLLLFLKIMYDYKKKFFYITSVVFIIGLCSFLTSYKLQNKEIKLNTIVLKIDNIRPAIWKTSSSIIKDNFLLGVGVNQAQKKLDKNYPKRGSVGAILQAHKLNCHNQYLQLFLEIGLVGILLFYMIFRSYFLRLKALDTLELRSISLFFSIIVFTFFIVESVLNRYAGLSFFLLFISLIIFYKKPIK